VLRDRAPHYPAVAHAHLGAGAWLYAAALVVGALAFAWLGLAGKRLFPVQLVDALRAAHSGHVGDYVAWWTFGMTVIGGLVLWAVAG
jgi:multicomponent Na+:H+ antiporter subunit D